MQMQHQQMVQSQEQQRQSLELSQRQQQDQYNLQIEQSNNQILNDYNQQRQQVEAEQATIMAKHKADLITHQREVENADVQFKYNNEAANRVYEQEQVKISEAKKKAAFAQQTALAKSIGSKGAILSAGRTGQSVGLLINDAERQSGFAQAQATAQLQSSIESSFLGMDSAYLQAQSANNTAASNIGMMPENPYMPSMPGIPEFVDPYTASSPDNPFEGP